MRRGLPHGARTEETLMENLAAVFKALSDRNRLAIFQTIRSCCCDRGVVNDATAAEEAGSAQGQPAGEGVQRPGEAAQQAGEGVQRAGEAAPPIDVGNSVSDIASRFDLSLSTVSHHLKELRNAGLIICEKRGQWVYCRPNPEVLKEIEGFLDDAQSRG